MNRERLEHAIRGARDVSGDNELYIFGSQAILGQYPDAHQQLRQPIEIDLSPKNKPDAVNRIDGALGENNSTKPTVFTFTVFLLKRQLYPRDGKRERTRFKIIWIKIRSAGVWKPTIWQPANSSLSGIKIEHL